MSTRETSTDHGAQPKSGEAPRLQMISIVIPARNEENNIERLEHELLTAVEALPFEFEFIFIDNSSTDQTGNRIKRICDGDPRWKYIRFSRDFTVEMSLTAGYHESRGDAIIVLYSDLQDPPEVIPRFIAKWKEGYDVVYGVRTIRAGDPPWRNTLVKIAYRLIQWFSDTPMPKDTGDFRLVTRQVRDALEECGEYNRYLRGLIAWLGFRQIGISYERRARLQGTSKAPFYHTLLFAVNAITSFSLKPLRTFTLLGFILVVVAFLASILYAVLWLRGAAPPGITTLVILGLMGIGLNSLGIGVLGEYIGRIYAETKSRPKYIVQETYQAPKRD